MERIGKKWWAVKDLNLRPTEGGRVTDDDVGKLVRRSAYEVQKEMMERYLSLAHIDGAEMLMDRILLNLAANPASSPTPQPTNGSS